MAAPPARIQRKRRATRKIWKTQEFSPCRPRTFAARPRKLVIAPGRSRPVESVRLEAPDVDLDSHDEITLLHGGASRAHPAQAAGRPQELENAGVFCLPTTSFRRSTTKARDRTGALAPGRVSAA